MARTIFLLAALTASAILAAQQPMSPNQGQGNPPAVVNVNPPPTIVVAGSGLYGPSVFMAPSAGFATPQAAAGATQTGFVYGSAGINLNNSPYLGVTSTLGPAPLVYEGGQTGYAYAPGGAVAGAPAETAAPAGRMVYDMAPSKYVGTLAPTPTGEVVNLSPPPPPVSLGEVAASNRAVAPHPINVYVNAAGQQLVATNVITGAVIASNVIPRTFIVLENQTVQAQPQPQNQPPVPPQALAPVPTQGQPLATNIVPAQAAPSTQQQPPQTEQSARTQQPAQTQPQGQPEANKPAQTQTKPAQSETNQEPTRLPATSTVLPLLGLLGLISTGLGLWVLRLKR